MVAGTLQKLPRIQLPPDASISDRVCTWCYEPPPVHGEYGVSGWSDLQWLEARFQIQVHGIAPILYSRLHGTPVWEILPDRLKRYIHDQYHCNTLRIEKMSRILSRILSELRALNIAAVPLKGSLLIHSHYSDPAHRPMADIDLLIQPEDAAAIGALLRSMGFSLTADMERHQVYSDGASPVSMDLEHPDNPVIVELHSRLIFRFATLGRLAVDVTDTVRSAPVTPLDENPQIPGISDDAHWFYLACHFSHHLYMGTPRLIQLMDLERVGRNFSRRSWDRVQEMAAATAAERLLAPAMIMAGRYTRLEVPQDLLDAICLETPALLQAAVRTYSLNQFAIDSESRLMKIQPPEYRDLGDKWLMIRHRLSMKYAVFFRLHMPWTLPGQERREAWIKLLFPGERELRAWYPRWIRQRTRVMVHAIHVLVLLGMPCLIRSGSAEGHAALTLSIRERRNRLTHHG